MFTKAIRTEWLPAEGVAVIYGESGEAHNGIAIPLAAIPTLAAHARRFLSGVQAKQAGHSNHGPWHFAQHCTAQTYDVGVLPTTGGEKVSLILDRGLDTQIGFAIEPEHARELGHQLSETADQVNGSRPSKN